MHPARRALIAAVLLGLGYFVAPLVREMLPSDASWEAQIQADAVTGTDVLVPYRVGTVPDEFWGRWDAQIAPYDAQQRADLGRRLQLYLDFLEAEYGEAADIYTAGVDPRLLSATLRELRAKLPAAFGDEAAAKMLADADEMREHAYRVSPRIGGIDPDAPDFRIEADSLRAWLTIARPRADELVAATDDR